MSGPESVEVEWQFDAPDLHAVAGWLRAQPPHARFSLVDRGERTQRDTYLDTQSWHAFHAGYTLRVREKNGEPETTLKALAPRGEGPIGRAEYTEPGGIADVALSEGPVGSRLRVLSRGAALRPLFTLVTRRAMWIVQADDAVLAEIALDDTTAEVAGAASSTLRRVEIEEVQPGSLVTLHSLVSALVSACALTPADSAKFEWGLRAAGLQPAPPDLGPVLLTADDRAVDRAFAVLRRRFSEFLAFEGGTALGEDPEQLHQMRVSTRRVRAALRVFDSVLPASLLEARDELRWAAQALGAVRDLDVLLDRMSSLQRAAVWEEATAIAPLAAQLERERREARAELLALFDSDRYASLVGALRTALVAGPPPGAAEITSRELGRRLVLRRYRRFRDEARALRRTSPAPEYHALRIRGKRLRYSLEVFVDLFGGAGRRAIDSLRAVQDLLGELQDLATTDARLRSMVQAHAAELPPDALVMIGRLMERDRERSAEIIGTFPRARGAVLRDFARLERVLRRRRAEEIPEEEDEDDPAEEHLTAVVVVPRVPRPARADASSRAARALQALIRMARSRRE